MPYASQLASALMSSKPKGLTYSKYPLPLGATSGIAEALELDIADAAYAAAISFAEALKGLEADAVTWALVKLYYASFYSLRLAMLLDEIVPFHCGEFFFCDLVDGMIRKAGASSHAWQWTSLWAYRRLTGWYYSADSAHAYDDLRTVREQANYRASFSDPLWPSHLRVASQYGLGKAFRIYRDDGAFFYTYLDEHKVLAYPTKMVMECCARYKQSGRELSEERSEHLLRIWPLKDRTPL